MRGTFRTSSNYYYKNRIIYSLISDLIAPASLKLEIGPKSGFLSYTGTFQIGQKLQTFFRMV